LLYHRVWPGQTEPCSDTMVRNCKFDDLFGGNGDGSMLVFGINNSTNAAYTGNDAFSGMRILNSTFGRNYININSSKDIIGSGGSATITTGSYAAIFTNCSDVVTWDIPANKPLLGRPSPISSVSVSTSSGWTISPTTMLSTPRDVAGGNLAYRFSFNVTPTAGGQAKITLSFTPGFSLVPSRPNAINNNTGNLVNADAFPGSNGVNEIDVYVVANGLDSTAVIVDFQANRIS